MQQLAYYAYNRNEPSDAVTKLLFCFKKYTEVDDNSLIQKKQIENLNKNVLKDFDYPMSDGFKKVSQKVLFFTYKVPN